ncbi:HK97 family phage prohead protease [Martelella lutilitoris]|uniref:HK97 family phage prohead protease n=1 Tax=Martelella lutilitoris TaxID=2583532 RepID=A0A7T7HMA2_9HYPH|nr:HK97 family phage prohead protease [Martelella lutilitoris]MAM13031.1 HK97 family phage prohead protease [Rhizobiaceae bacterium]QQM31726.1 HK97 family phage prohead protease [Martelella lutilitoris]
MALQYKFAPLEAEIDDRGRVTGYASKFGIRDMGGDIVVKGAFSKSERKPKMLFQHDPGQVVGVWDRIEEDNTGLYVEGRVNLGSTLGKDVHSNLEFGAIDGMSIGFRTKDAVKTKSGRELRSVDLWEVSFVTFPMLPEALVSSVKSIEGESPAILKRFVENIMREADFSADEAKAAAAAVARVRAEREVSDGQKSLTLEDFKRALSGL